MSEKSFERQPAMGNLVASKITDHEGEGLVIEWVNSNIKPTLISSEGDESDMYNFVKSKYPDLKKAAGAGFAIATDEHGLPTQIGEINGEPVRLRVKE